MDNKENATAGNLARSLPVSEWRANLQRLKVGYHIRNRSGQIGVVTWISHGCLMYRMGTRELNGH